MQSKKNLLSVTVFVLLTFLLLPPLAEAQTSCSSIDNFTITVQTTPSTCQSNGTITVTLGGDLSDISKVEYSLTSANGSFSLISQLDNVLTGIPPGTYTVDARAFCKENESHSVVHSATNVVVGGNYVVPVASLNLTSTRNSYQDCATGRIVLNVTGGKGTFTFTVVSAPAGVTTPVTVAATKNGTVFTLAGENWPAGNYTVLADDGCYTASANFALGAITGVPTTVSQLYTMFESDINNTQGSCNYLKLSPSGWTSSSNRDYYYHWQAGLYEIGAAPAGTNINAVTNWTTWGLLTYINISPYNITNFYTANSLGIYIRLKPCPANSRSFTTNINKPSASSFSTARSGYFCNNYGWTTNVFTDSRSMFCYPLNVTIKDPGGTVVYNNPNWLYNISSNDTTLLDYGVTYTETVTDQNGTTISFPIPAYSPSLYLSVSYDTLACAGFFFTYNLSTPLPDTCTSSQSTKVTVTDPGGAVVQQVFLFDQSPVNTPILEYDKTYTIRADFPDGTFYTTTRTEPLPVVTYSFGISSGNSCSPNTSYISISRSTSPSYRPPVPNQPYPVGTTFTITGPPGYTTQTRTAITEGYYMSMPETFLPPGLYTLYVDNDCGKSYTATYNYAGGYDYTDFGYTSEQAVPACSGIRIYPKGQMTLAGNVVDTYFHLRTGPEGYDRSVIQQGGSYLLSTPGIYVLAMSNSLNRAVCAIATDTINYTPPPLMLDANHTAAYVCVGAGIGNISISGLNGTAPYTYQLYDSANVVKQPVDDITKDGIAHFVYGEGGKTYTVRVSDACGNNFAQQVKVINLTTEHIVYTDNNPICEGDTIKLHCVTLGTTAYAWTGPNGYTSSNQHPVILNAQANSTGWYKVTVQPEFCGTAVEDSIYITVDNLTLVSGVGETYTICIHGVVPVLSDTTVTGGTGIYTYQWQSSPDGTTGWTDIDGATDSDYQPAISTDNAGKYYYRRITTDRCSTLNGNVITLTVKSCYIPVNPGLMIRLRK